MKAVLSYQLNIGFRHSGADAAGSTYWAFHNPQNSRKLIVLRRFVFEFGFDGTAVAGTNVAYSLQRATGNIDPTGGSTVDRHKKHPDQGASVLLDANIQQSSTPLTFAPTFEPSGFHFIRIPVSITGVVAGGALHWAQLGDLRSSLPRPHVFRPNDSLAIRALATTVIGQGLHGSIEIDEVDL